MLPTRALEIKCAANVGMVVSVREKDGGTGTRHAGMEMFVQRVALLLGIHQTARKGLGRMQSLLQGNG